MNWTIRVKPNNTALTSWSWSAVRDDQETVRSGSGYPTSEEAVAAAEAAAQAFEDGDGVIRDATFEQQFVPTSEVP